MRPVYAVVIALVPLLLAGCSKEKDFDARYQQQADNLAAAANSLEQEMESRMVASNRIDGLNEGQAPGSGPK